LFTFSDYGNISTVGDISGNGTLTAGAMTLNNTSGWNYIFFNKGALQEFAIEVSPSNALGFLSWNGSNWVVIQASSLLTTSIYNN
jgi:hypothetical protein